MVNGDEKGSIFSADRHSFCRDKVLMVSIPLAFVSRLCGWGEAGPGMLKPVETLKFCSCNYSVHVSYLIFVLAGDIAFSGTFPI